MHTPTILVVDDDASVVSLMADLLEVDGFTVVGAPDGYAALRELDRMRPDLVILDVMMPGLSGLDVLRAIRSSAETKHTPVLIVSAKRDEVSIWDGLRNGCDVYVTKPFDPAELTVAVRRLLGLSAA